MNLKVIPTNWQEHGESLKAIRTEVFVKEQQVPEEMEWEEEDNHAQHFLATLDQKAVGTARLLSSGQIGRMAVLKPYRQQGIGGQLLQACLDAASQQKLEPLFLHAQNDAIPFYEKFGFVIAGKEFYEAGIAHHKMILDPTNSSPDASGTQVQLGKSDQVHRHKVSAELISLIATLVKQGSRSVYLLCWDLNPELLDNETIRDAFSYFLRKNPHANAKILIHDSAKITRYGHRLLALSRRLPSHIEIRKINQDFSEVEEFSLTVDATGSVLKPNLEQLEFTCQFNSKAKCLEKNNLFENIWRHSEADPNLRALSL